MIKPDYIIYTDGGARGNPGPAATGYVIEGGNLGKKEYGDYVGETTNNVAEYQAAIYGLKKLKLLIGTAKAKDAVVEMRADSQLLVRQALGEYKVKEPGMQDLFMELWNLRLDFKKVLFTHVRREDNQDADRMVNYVLDREANKLF